MRLRRPSRCRARVRSSTSRTYRTQAVLQRELLDTLPTNKSMHGFAALTVGLTSTASFGKYDVGGNKTDSYGFVTIHGLDPNDGRMLYNGMTFNNMVGFGGGREQAVLRQSDGCAGSCSRDGRHRGRGRDRRCPVERGAEDRRQCLRGSRQFRVSDGALQSDNLSDTLRARGLSNVTELKKVYDYGGGVGGPIKRDKLWFYTSHRWWGSQEWAAGKYYNQNQGGPIYAPDLSRQAHTTFYQQDNSGRVKWQATNKQNYTFSLHKQHNCNCDLFIDYPDRSYESTVDYTYFGIWLGQADMGLSDDQPAAAAGRGDASAQHDPSGLPARGGAERYRHSRPRERRLVQRAAGHAHRVRPGQRARLQPAEPAILRSPISRGHITSKSGSTRSRASSPGAPSRSTTVPCPCTTTSATAYRFRSPSGPRRAAWRTGCGITASSRRTNGS